ncbi:glycosyltransferase [Rhodoferax sp.]|uniref:glycosyltransferase family 2 protein n=1 Tax=Rhodoferax sp. TaxID=50421 RepID=UPI0025E18F36|nr:glycosyltransferase [Rhodoferax sp.]MCM2342362.1 glycosyltransferase [Rhodoferax sp.]
MSSPTVSVCITTYNQDRYIKDCVVSALAQISDTSIEILIGDDGTGPQTPRIVASLMELYPGKIRYFKHEKNLGPSANYQFLIREARGLYLAHLDGDDFWLPGKLAVQLAWLQDHPDSVACYTNAVVVSDDQQVMGVFSSPISQPIDLAFLLAKGNFLNHSSLLYRATHKDVILGFVGPFIDYRIHLNFARFGELGLINAAYVVYRLGSEHSMVRTTPTLVQDLYFEALASVLTEPSVSSEVRHQALRHFWQAIAVQCVARSRYAWGWAWAKKIRAICLGSGINVLLPGVLLAVTTLTALVLRKGTQRMTGKNDLRVLHER